jgi:transcriptional regulator GlxA family with amidase domain
VDPTRRFHDNGHILTAAGISAGIDCALHLVGQLRGEEMAEKTADYMEYRRA